MAATSVTVLYEDNHLLAVCKPANLPTMGTAPDASSLVTWARQYLKEKYGKPGNVYVGVVSRLDALVTGVVVLARTSKAAARLTETFRSREARKLYWAIVEGVPAPPAATCVDWLRKDEPTRRMHVTRPQHPEAQEARLTYRTLAQLPRGTLLEIALESGRKHQIRVQLAHRGHPVLGDVKYGSEAAFPIGIALHSRQLEFLHPVRKTPLCLEAPVPVYWHAWGVS